MSNIISLFFVRLKIKGFVEIQVELTLKHIQKSQPPLHDNVYISLFFRIEFVLLLLLCRVVDCARHIKPFPNQLEKQASEFRVFHFGTNCCILLSLSSIKPKGQCTMMIEFLFIGTMNVTLCY